MQEKTSITFTAAALEEIKAATGDKAMIIFHELLANQPAIEDLIIAYHYRSRGRIFNLRVEKPAMKSTLSGSFRVNYSVGHFNACADVDTSEEQHMTVQLEIDPLSGNTVLSGEFIPEREPDEF